MRVWCMVLLVLVVGMTGCLDAGQNDESSSEEDAMAASGPLVVPWGLEACEAVIVVLPAERAAVMPYLPDGFAPMTLEEFLGTGTTTGAAGEANFGIEALDCRSGAGLAGTIDGIAYGGYFIGVHPPQELAEDVSFHFVKIETLVPDADRRAFLQGHGIPAVDGAANVRETYRAMAAARTVSTLTLGAAQHTLEASGPAYNDPDGSFVEFTDTGHGLAVWRAAFTWSDVFAGPATVDVPGGTIAADVLGTGEVTGASFLGGVTFHDASLTLPARVNATDDA